MPRPPYLRRTPRFASLAAGIHLATMTGSWAAGIPVFNSETSTNGPMAPAEVVANSILPPGFKMSVFAAEPDVQQPIAMATDAKGRLWVAENYTYSEASVGYHPELRDRIIVFEDTHNQGRFDKRTVVWDDAQRLTSVEIGYGGIWALALPNLVFIPDKDGDGIPDGPPQIILDGFEFQKGRHTVANGLRWGPDGWLYARHGIQSTSLIGPPGALTEKRVAMNVGIWRYHPTRHITEVVAQGTTNPWGMDWDSRGELFFINTVIGHLWHVIPGAHYRRMYGDDPVAHIYDVIEQTADHVHWATGESWTDVRKGVSDLTSAAGGGHAHTGLLIYQGGQWPEVWNGKVMTVNFHGRRINVDQLEREGSGFVAHHREDAFRFADPWFRGVDIVAAPDGSIFVSDWSDTGECHNQSAIHRTSGRIYKISYAPARDTQVRDLTSLSDPALAELEKSSNDWEARQSQKLLAERSLKGSLAPECLALLRELMARDKNEVVRLRALWTLHTARALRVEELRAALTRTESERAWALRLAEDERTLDAPHQAAFDRLVQVDMMRMAVSDSSALVRVTIASLLQKLPADRRHALARALLSHAEDAHDHNLPLMIWYGIESIAKTDPDFVGLIVNARLPKVQRLGARRLAEDIDASPKLVDELLMALTHQTNPDSRLAVLDGLTDGFAGRRQVVMPRIWGTISPQLSESGDEALKSRVRNLSVLFGDARVLGQMRQIALDSAAEIVARKSALQSILVARPSWMREVCEQVLPVRELAATAAEGLATYNDANVAKLLLGAWPGLAEADRFAILTILTSRPVWANALLDAMRLGQIPSKSLPVALARHIRDLNDGALTQKLTEVWGALRDPDEKTKREAMKQWQSKVTTETLKRANLFEGQKIFTTTCAVCHKLYGAGADIGPDLTGTGRHNLEYLLENILFPSAIVAAEYRQFTVTLKDGRILNGIIRSRTNQAIVLVMPGETMTIGKTDIVEEQASTLSLMPEGLLDGLNEIQSVNLIAYLMSTAPPRADGQ
jgi:putative membrane-bound dehydrogenase-like protein